MNTNSENDVMEIDLLELFGELRRHIVLILAATILGGALAGAFSKFMITPQYQSTAVMFVLSKDTTLTSLADLQIGSQLTQDYKVIVASRPVLERTIENLNLNMNYQTLGSRISIANPSSTRILNITATDPDPARAKAIADMVAEVSSDYIADIMEMVPPKIIESGEIPTQKSSPRNGRNAMMGALIGLVLACGFVTLRMLLDDTVTDAEDVSKYLGLSVLASVPERQGDEDEKETELKAERAFGSAGSGSTRNASRSKGKNKKK